MVIFSAEFFLFIDFLGSSWNFPHFWNVDPPTPRDAGPPGVGWVNICFIDFLDIHGSHHSYYKNSYVTWAPGILSRHLVNGCVLKCSCIGLMVFRNLSCLGIMICYINIIGIIPAYACNVLNVCDAFVQILQPLANVHETKWTHHVKRDCDVAVLIIAVVSLTLIDWRQRKRRHYVDGFIVTSFATQRLAEEAGS